MTMFAHQLKDAKDLMLATTEQLKSEYPKIRPQLVEKDYWIMHTLWGLKSLGFNFQLKGGTSLSKGFGIIERFSEDVDIRIDPENHENIPIGKNHDKDKHIEQRKLYFDSLAEKIKIPDMLARRDYEFDDNKYRNAGIRLHYHSFFEPDVILKDGILLELGFDQTSPNEPITITSWAYQHALRSNIAIKDNLALDVDCYFPEYTFVEKLQAVSRKVRLQQQSGNFSTNFLRHYYDIYKLLHEKRVLDFIGTDEYKNHKKSRFGNEEKSLNINLAFNLDKDIELFEQYVNRYDSISGLFIQKNPGFQEIFNKISEFKDYF